MTHEFIKGEIPNYLKAKFYVLDNNSYKKCKNCSLEIVSVIMDYADYMYINGIEVFNDYYKLDQIIYSCEELIIKNIIE